MINYETILSNYEDKLTLMQWLEKVEEALNDATATGFHVTKTGQATLTFSIDFDDGTTLTSEELTLNQGESVASAYIQNGNLHLVLTNGDDLDAGNMFNGNVTIAGNLTAVSVQTSVIQQNDNSGIGFSASEVSFNNDVSAQGNIETSGTLKTDTLDTSSASEISAQKPVVEVMNGYSVSITQKTGITNTPIYVSAVKNGNKLTLVYFASIIRTSAISGFTLLCNFYIPSSVGTKLSPTTIASNPFIDYRKIGVVNKSTGAFVDLGLGFYKSSNTQINILAISGTLDALALNTEYLIRYETTFLLSENLAS